MNMQLGHYGGLLIESFEGPPRLIARECEGDAWELGWGSTYWHDGRGAVKEGDTCTYEEAVAMYWHAIKTEVKPLIDNYTREPNQNQFDALASLAYNAGGYNIVAESSAYRFFNAGRFEDAANKFDSYISATSDGPSKKERELEYYDGVWEWQVDARGRDIAVWIGADGKPCRYRKKMRGLLRRRLSEACLFSGYNWTEAARNDRVHLKLERYWDENEGRWGDRVINRTYFKDILPIAQRYPLPELPPSQHQAPALQPKPSASEASAPTVTTSDTVPAPPKKPPPVASEPDPPKEAGFSLPEEKPKEAEKVSIKIPEPPVPKAAKGTPTYTLANDFDPSAGFKSIWQSKRFWGWVLIVTGRFSFVTDAGAEAASGIPLIGPIAASIANDPMMFDMTTGFLVMFAGEGLRYWGEKTAKKPLV